MSDLTPEKCPIVRPDPSVSPVSGAPLGYNRRFDSTQFKTGNAMEAERINALSALLNDLTGREAELRRYL
jgi:hypothetical protein